MADLRALDLHPRFIVGGVDGEAEYLSWFPVAAGVTGAPAPARTDLEWFRLPEVFAKFVDYAEKPVDENALRIIRAYAERFAHGVRASAAPLSEERLHELATAAGFGFFGQWQLYQGARAELVAFARTVEAASGVMGLHAARDAVVRAAQKWGDTDADDELAGLAAEFDLSEALTALAAAGVDVPAPARQSSNQRDEKE